MSTREIPTEKTCRGQRIQSMAVATTSWRLEFWILFQEIVDSGPFEVDQMCQGSKLMKNSDDKNNLEVRIPCIHKSYPTLYIYTYI